MKKLITLTLVLGLLNVNGLFSIADTRDSLYPASEKSKAIQKSNQRNERKGSTNGSLK